ncbi:MAG: TetR/AcrR family transcriptional regulator, partial [Paracoccaceae bacterium]
ALRSIYADWLTSAQSEGSVRLSARAEECALAITSALKGAKATASDFASYQATLYVMAKMFASGFAKD